jgi:hypothetical protein
MGRPSGDPFQRWPVTLVLDLRYASSWIFFPSLLEIHSGGGWNPRLLTHEFLHAFRGQRGLTMDASWSYVPTLSGFEEGFAEGVAYLAMNEYVRLFCSKGDCADHRPQLRGPARGPLAAPRDRPGRPPPLDCGGMKGAPPERGPHDRPSADQRGPTIFHWVSAKTGGSVSSPLSRVVPFAPPMYQRTFWPASRWRQTMSTRPSRL